MLKKAMDSFQLQKVDHIEKIKAQYTDHAEKTFFRASELGGGDRKILFSFFAHRLPKRQKAVKNLRQLEHGDAVHERYQKAWRDMGALISMEERVTSKFDPVLRKHEWEWMGHYDGLLDLNIVRGYAQGKVWIRSEFIKVPRTPSEEEELEQLKEQYEELYAHQLEKQVLDRFYDPEEDISSEAYELIEQLWSLEKDIKRLENKGYWKMKQEIDPEYAEKIGYYREDYQPLKMVADIKTMNPWGFKKIRQYRDVSGISGYLDQIMFYMYMLKTPYGSIYIENKEDNDVLEVQVVWEDFQGGSYSFSSDIHGDPSRDVVQVTVDTERFEAMLERLDRLWDGVKHVKQFVLDASEDGTVRIVNEDGERVYLDEILPPKCSDDPQSFPCSWGHRKGEPQYCEFYHICWNAKNQLPEEEPCPPEKLWAFDSDEGVVYIDSRKVPEHIVTPEQFLEWVAAQQEVDVAQYMASATSEASLTDALEEKQITDLFDAEGNLVTDLPEVKEAQEYLKEDGTKAVKCPYCASEVTYKRLAASGTKRCAVCSRNINVKRS